MHYIALFYFITLPFLPLLYFVLFERNTKYFGSLQRTIIVFFFALICSYLYTINIEHELSQKELSGDASMYMESAVKYHSTHTIYTSNKLFSMILSFACNSLNYSFAMRTYLSLIVAAIYFFGEVLIISNFGNKTSIVIYFLLIGLNPGISSLAFVIIRDSFILLSVIVLFVVIEKYKSSRCYTNAFLALLLLYALILLYFMQFLILFLFVAATASSLLITKGIKRWYILLGLIFVSYAFIDKLIGMDMLMRIFRVNFLEGQRAAQGGASLGTLGDFFRFITGPGIVRPIFGDIYFLTRYPFFYKLSYTWAIIVWYICLIFTSPVFSRPRLIFKSHNLYFLIFIILFVLVYTLSDSGQTGLRKRVIMYFLYAVWFFCNYPKLQIKVLRGNALMVTGLTSLLIAIANIFSFKI